MSEVLSRGGITLLKREKASLVAATGLIFERLKATSQDISLQDSLMSYKGGTWGSESVEGIGYPILRSSNMRGKRVDVVGAAWCNVTDEQAKAFSLESGDILVTKSSGSFDLVGKAALFDDPNDGNLYLFSNFTMRLRPDRKKLIPEYLAWFLRSPQALSWRFENQQTTVGLRNLQTKEYLSQVIPVPSLEIQKQIVNYLNAIEIESKESKIVDLPEILSEQRRIVEHVEALATRIKSISNIRNTQITSIRSLLVSSFNKVIENARWLPMREVAPLIRRPVKIDASTDYPELGIRSFGRGTFHKPAISGVMLGTKRLFRIEPNDLIFNNVFAWEGAVAVAKNEDVDRFGSHRFITCLPIDKLATSEFLCFYFLTREGLEKLGTASPGGAGRNRTLGLTALENILVPVPEYEKQVWFDSVQARLASLRELQSATGEELSALLPSVLDRAFKGEL